MRPRALRVTVVAVLCTIALGLIGVAWWFINDRLQYHRFIAFQEKIDQLEEKKATREEVLEVLGPPDQIAVHESYGKVSWFYSGGEFRGYPQPTFVLRLDLKTSRVISVGIIQY